MSAIPYEQHEEGWDGYEDDEALELPGRPRRQFFNRRSAALFAVIVGAIGFYAGVRVEKGQVSSSGSTASALSSAGASRTGASGASGLAARARAAFGGGGAAGALGGGSASFGTVTSVSGHTIYVTEATGNVVKVTLSSATKVTKNVAVSKSAIHPGDNVVVSGLKNSGATIAATSVSDTGAGAARSSAASSSSGGSGGASSAVGSLFGGGGGG